MESRGRDKFYKAKPLIAFISNIYKIFPLKIRGKLLEHYRMVKGIKGIVIRYALLKTIAASCGDNVSIQPGVYLLSPQNLSIGNNVSIHPMCYIDAFGKITIGNDVSIAHAVTIMSSSHMFDNLSVPIKDQPLTFSQTVIEDNVWIGAKATILSGRTVKRGSVIAANAVVTHDVQSNTVVAGIPAKIILERN